MEKHVGFNVAVHLLKMRTETRLANIMIKPERAGPFTQELVYTRGTLMKMACQMDKEH